MPFISAPCRDKKPLFIGVTQRHDCGLAEGWMMQSGGYARAYAWVYAQHMPPAWPA